MTIYVGNTTISDEDFNADGTPKNILELPTDGLLLHLNAFNFSNSSPWFDSAQNIQFDSNGTMTPKVWDGGVPCIDFNGSGYWQSSTAAGDKVDMTGAFTLIFVFRADVMGARRTIFEKAGNSHASYEQEIACTWETDNNISFYHQYNAYDYGYFGVSTNGEWNLRAIKSRADKQEAYAWTSGAWSSNVLNNRSDSQITRSGAVRVGSGYAGTVTDGYLHAVLVYGVDLSTDSMNRVWEYYRNQFRLMGKTLYN